MDQKLKNDKLDSNVKRAQLAKQYGVVDGYELTFSGDGNYSPWAQGDGTIIWLNTNAAGEYLANQEEVDAQNAADANANAVLGTATTDDKTKAQRATMSTSVTVGSSISNANKPGAIDKQIKGFDTINYKDVLTTMDQRVALMQNAKIPENSAEKTTRVALINKILEGSNIAMANYN